MKIDMKVRRGIVNTWLGLSLSLIFGLGTNLEVHAQHKAPAASDAAWISSAEVVAHRRHGPPVHRGASHHHSGMVIHRGSRSAPPNPQARMADWYARTAVSQAHAGWRLGCAQSHPRWSTSYQDHFQWAYRQSFHQAQREIERRERVLDRCLAW